ncbi:uncharacterized protein PV07_04707 [Cladophialophora immunda]|uniref:Uncharacterized protein n=1 Tax=Cladophialophora immunda TaxID=569365 RepID=A0A0D2CZ44_9EURO|nr:uncharacterized protein PV07_04707 [Cladophialophora immunda]KIW28844.1 hypothetical protein PV07_04707 [Cladophialophora immunda]
MKRYNGKELSYGPHSLRRSKRFCNHTSDKTSAYFRFLDLSPKIRCLCYEKICTNTIETVRFFLAVHEYSRESDFFDQWAQRELLLLTFSSLDDAEGLLPSSQIAISDQERTMTKSHSRASSQQLTEVPLAYNIWKYGHIAITMQPSRAEHPYFGVVQTKLLPELSEDWWLASASRVVVQPHKNLDILSATKDSFRKLKPKYDCKMLSIQGFDDYGDLKNQEKLCTLEECDDFDFHRNLLNPGEILKLLNQLILRLSGVQHTERKIKQAIQFIGAVKVNWAHSKYRFDLPADLDAQAQFLRRVSECEAQLQALLSSRGIVDLNTKDRHGRKRGITV